MLKAGDLARREDRGVKGVKIGGNPTRSGDITCMSVTLDHRVQCFRVGLGVKI